MEKVYDVIIIGAGPAGMAATLYASRANLSTLLLERGIPGGEMLNTSEIENYPGFSSVLGPELANKMYEGAMQFGAEYAYGDVNDIQLDGHIKHVHVGEKVYSAFAIVIATGAHHRKLNVLGEEQYNGRGVSYCAVCDGAFFKNEKLVVVGGGDSAVEEGTYLTQFAKEVTIIHRRDQLRAQKILQDRAFKNEKLNFIWDSVVKEIIGEDNVVKGVTIKNVKTGQIQQIDARGVFIYVGTLPNTQAFKHLNITDEEGWIVTNEKMQTTIPGIFAVGDVRAKTLRQVVTAVGDGGQAGQEVYHYVEQLKEQIHE
ncbi:MULTISPECIES: thioredoxin-disulfide reductase [unclassified Granulicatella]|uniref:thioredoxin-disulfide reductase n=1 Tax=unclassified Granulicatella TaxID=2630493 RepID=UPI001ADDB634|nr:MULTISPECIES: thioredoxin-disulfide reductase [unclassified Granulicatella]